MKTGFNLIYFNSDLVEIIKFLESSFPWSAERSTKIYNILSNQNPKIPRAACLIKNKSIVSAILLFHQGWHQEDLKNIINLSSWYSIQSYRGIKSINFAKTLICNLEDYIITDYTPTKAAYEIFKYLKFNNIKVEKLSLGFKKKSPYFSIREGAKFFSMKKSLTRPLLEIYKLPLNEFMDAKKSTYSYESFNFGFIKFRALNVFLYSNTSKINLFEMFNLIILNRALRVNIFFQSNAVVCSGWLIKNASNEDTYIPPLSSEFLVQEDANSFNLSR